MANAISQFAIDHPTTTLFLVSAAGIIVQGVIAFVSNRIAKERENDFTERLKLYEDKIKREYDVYKAGLDYLSFENQTKFSKLHVARAECIKQFHAELHIAERTLFNLGQSLGVDNDSDDFHRAAYFSIKKLEESEREIRLYFDIEFSNRLHKLFGLLYKNADHIRATYKSKGQEQENNYIMWTNGTAEIVSIMEAVEEDFREMLGVRRKMKPEIST